MNDRSRDNGAGTVQLQECCPRGLSLRGVEITASWTVEIYEQNKSPAWARFF